ncbi:hypothetical protein CSC82_20515, partial [Rhodobacteraceae bacterium 4F10]
MYCFKIVAQENSVEIKAKLDIDKDVIHILQKTTFYNHSSSNLDYIFLHNWANSYKNDNTPLAKRFIEDYRKTFHFSKDKDRGYSKIRNLTVNF